MPEGTRAPLSRAALRRVLGSLLASELASMRGGRPRPADGYEPVSWSEDTRLTGDGPGEPGCDSLDLLRLGAAVNEMFHLHEAGDETELLQRSRVGDWLDEIEAAWRAGVGHVTFTTSGSTATPKRCPHPIGHLAAEIDVLAERFADRRRIVALAPAHHIYGFLFTAMLPDRLGAEVWPAERSGAAGLARGLRDGDLVVSFPERWAWLARSLPAWPEGVVGVASTAPCPAGLADDLTGKGLSALVEVYGSSETAGIAWRTDPHGPYRLMPHWRLEPAPDATFVLQHRSGRRIAMPDRVALAGPDGFRLQGRVDGAVQVGGLNVHPAAIADRLRSAPGVLAAAVRLMRPDEGTRLKAFVVPASGVEQGGFGAELALWCGRHLAAAERPTQFTFGAKLPISALGKAADW